VNYERFVNTMASGALSTGGNDLISIPLIPSSSLPFDTFIGLGAPTNASKLATNGTFYGFAPYNTTTPAYENFTLGAKGKGYGVATALADALLRFSGAVEPHNVSISISKPTGGSQWNLVGNPYPSYINFLAFLTANAAVLDANTCMITVYSFILYSSYSVL
jgi:hypothetical protein